MLEVDPSLAASKPVIEVHPLGIGGKSDPARLVFDSILGDALMISIIDTGYNFKAIIQRGELVTPPQKMPKLPVAQVMWKLLPNFKEATQTWIEEGGAHHTILTTQYKAQDIVDLANIYGIEAVVIG